MGFGCNSDTDGVVGGEEVEVDVGLVISSCLAPSALFGIDGCRVGVGVSNAEISQVLKFLLGPFNCCNFIKYKNFYGWYNFIWKSSFSSCTQGIYILSRY